MPRAPSARGPALDSTTFVFFNIADLTPSARRGGRGGTPRHFCKKLIPDKMEAYFLEVLILRDLLGRQQAIGNRQQGEQERV